MAISYKSCADMASAVHSCDACNGSERGRVRSLVLIKPGTTINTTTLTLTEWQTAIEAGNIIIIPNTSGSLEDAEKEGTGYGDEVSRIIGHDYTLNVVDPSFAANKTFYAAAEKVGWHVGWRTETLIHLNLNAPAQLVATEKVDDNLDADVVWNLKLKWTSDVKPVSIAFTAIADLFRCFEVTTTTGTGGGSGN